MNIVTRISRYGAYFTGFGLLLPALASAHVIVTPGQVGVGAESVFSVSSPNEQQTPIVKLTLDVPKGVSDVTPTVADGWTISTTTTGSGDSAQVSSITWSGGQIPVGQRADFSFGAQAPGSATTLDWKAYQTYADGSIVHWDQTPAGSDDATGNAGPYSETKVVNDLTVTANTSDDSNTDKKTNNTLILVVAVLALAVSVAAVLRPNGKTK